MTIRVKARQGGKDRYAILSQNLLVELRQYWKRYLPAIWLFPNGQERSLKPREAWHIFRSAKQRAGLKRAVVFIAFVPASPPILEAGVDLRSISFDGHTSILSTQRYLRLRPQNVDYAVSPLDRSSYRWPKPCCRQSAAVAARRGVELADIFRAHGESYRRDHPLPVSHLKVMQAVERCRTAALGGHLEQCDSCGYERPAYNSAETATAPSVIVAKQSGWRSRSQSFCRWILSSRLHSTP